MGEPVFGQKKLDALRAKYAEAKGSDVFDPEFKKVVSLVFKSRERRKLPYSDVSTFLDAPYRPEAPEQPDFGGLDVALLGVPMDLGVTNRAGARLGPRAVRAVERIGPYNHALKVVPLAECRAGDIGDVPMRSRFSLESCIEDIAEYYARISAAGVRALSVGGDHSITYPILKALGRKRPVGLVHIDAHCDTGGEYDGSKFNHGGPFRLAVLDGALDPERTIQIGIRGPAEFLWEFSYESGMTVIHIEDVARLGIEGVIAKALEVVGGGPTYISFDVDGLDPAFAPGTGTPEAGGLTPREAQQNPPWPQGHRRHWRRRRRGGAPLRSDHQHRHGRRANAVRDFLADGARPELQAPQLTARAPPPGKQRALRMAPPMGLEAGARHQAAAGGIASPTAGDGLPRCPAACHIGVIARRIGAVVIGRVCRRCRGNDGRRHIGVGIGIDRRCIGVPQAADQPPPGEAAVVPAVIPVTRAPVMPVIAVKAMDIAMPAPVRLVRVGRRAARREHCRCGERGKSQGPQGPRTPSLASHKSPDRHCSHSVDPKSDGQLAYGTQEPRTSCAGYGAGFPLPARGAALVTK